MLEKESILKSVFENFKSIHVNTNPQITFDHILSVRGPRGIFARTRGSEE